MSKDRFKVLEEQTQIMQGIASAFPKESPQYIAIQNATFALIFAISEQYESFSHFVRSSHEDLTDEQKDNLRRMGIPF